MLSLEDVSLRYGAVHAVNNVSLRFEPGRRVAMIGPNGAGKSSLLALLGGQVRVTSGRIRLDRNDITAATPHQRSHLGIARSFQITSLFPRLSVREQAAFALFEPNRVGWVPRRGARRARGEDVAALLRDWGLPDDVWERPPHELSYGQQRELELALALARRPRVLLLDEPNVGLTDAENAALVERITGFDRDMTVVLVAHDMDMVFGVAERVIVMHRGAVLVDGEPEAVRRDPAVAEIYFGGVAGAA